ncbi:MAG: transglutaminase domain-containing protein [Blautia sp.]|nr:transglutaminase domain-containing protein [Blautia sp.]
MFEDKSKLIMVIGGTFAALLIIGSIVVKFQGGKKNDSVQLDEKVVIADVTIAPTPEPEEDEIYVPNENMLYGIQEFMESIPDDGSIDLEGYDTDSEKGKREREAIEAVLNVWDYKEKTVKDSATEQGIHSASEKVAALEDRELKQVLTEALRMAMDEFNKRNARPSATPTVTPTPPTLISTPTTIPSPTPIILASQSGSQMYLPTPTPIILQSPSTSQGVSQQILQPVHNDQTTFQIPLPTEAPPLYAWVAGTNLVSFVPVSDNRYPYDLLSEKIKDTIDRIFVELETGTEATAEIPDQDYSFEEIMTIIVAERDIFFPYSEISVSVIQDEGLLQFTGMNEIREAYQQNKTLKEDIIPSIAREIIEPGMTEKDAVVSINNYVTAYMTYGTASNAIIDAVGTDRGYANFFKDLCNAVGIQAYVDYGTIDGEPQGRAWVKVLVDGIWYYCDPCMNDGYADEYPFMFANELWYGRKQEYPGESYSIDEAACRIEEGISNASGEMNSIDSVEE